MGKFHKISLFLLRIIMGWLFLYAGVTKVINPNWSAAGYLKGAKLLPGFYNWLLSPNILPGINFVNEWGLTLLGVSLILGIGVRFSSILGAVLMILYYLPLGFPYPDAHSFIVDDHIIDAAVLLFFAGSRAGRVMGLDNWCANLPLCAKYPKLRSLWG